MNIHIHNVHIYILYIYYTSQKYLCSNWVILVHSVVVSSHKHMPHSLILPKFLEAPWHSAFGVKVIWRVQLVTVLTLHDELISIVSIKNKQLSLTIPSLKCSTISPTQHWIVSPTPSCTTRSSRSGKLNNHRSAEHHDNTCAETANVAQNQGIRCVWCLATGKTLQHIMKTMQLA